MPRVLALLLVAGLLLPACSSSDTSIEVAPPLAVPAEAVEQPVTQHEVIDLQLDLAAADGKVDPIIVRSGETKDQQIAKPQAGQLTAGEWDDLEHWEHWLELLTNTETESDPNFWVHEKTWKVAPRHRYPVVVLDENDQPAVDVEVELSSRDDGRSIWRTRTDNAGRAWLFDGAVGPVTEAPLTLSALGPDHTHTVDAPTDGTATEIRLSGTLTTPNAVDVMFVVDTTGSMSDELHYLKAELGDVITRIEARHPGVDLRLSVNFYRDHGDLYVVRPFAFSSNVGHVQDQLHLQAANGGGDTPEAVDEALENAVDGHQWSSSARTRIAFIVLDAPPHATDTQLERYHAATRNAAAAGIRLIPIIGSGGGKDTEYLMRSTAILTGGTYVFLTDDSGIGGGHTRPTIGPHDVEYLRDLLVRVIDERMDCSSCSGPDLPAR